MKIQEGQLGTVTRDGVSVDGKVIAVGVHSFAVAFTAADGWTPGPWFSANVQREDGAYKRHGEPVDQALWFLAA